MALPSFLIPERLIRKGRNCVWAVVDTYDDGSASVMSVTSGQWRYLTADQLTDYSTVEP